MSNSTHAADLLQSLVDRLVILWRERAKVAANLKEAKKFNVLGIPALSKEICDIDADIQKARAEAAQHGFTAKALDIVVRETMETEAERRKRREFEAVVDLYREVLGLKGRR